MSEIKNQLYTMDAARALKSAGLTMDAARALKSAWLQAYPEMQEYFKYNTAETEARDRHNTLLEDMKSATWGHVPRQVLNRLNSYQIAVLIGVRKVSGKDVGQGKAQYRKEREAIPGVLDSCGVEWSYTTVNGVKRYSLHE